MIRLHDSKRPPWGLLYFQGIRNQGTKTEITSKDTGHSYRIWLTPDYFKEKQQHEVSHGGS